MTSLMDFVMVIAIGVCGTVVSEGISWLLFYRTERYQELSKQHEEQSGRLDREKERDNIISIKEKKAGAGAGGAAAGDGAGMSWTGEIPKERGLKVENLEKQLKETTAEISRLQFRSTMATSVVMIGLFSLLNSRLSGIIVARLPFVPISFLSSITHRGIPGDDLTQCSAIFLYIIFSLAFRQHVQKILGLKSHKSDMPSLFKMPS